MKSGLHGDVVSVKFSSGSAVQRCCFLLSVAPIFKLKRGHRGCLCAPLITPSLLLSLSWTLSGCGSF